MSSMGEGLGSKRPSPASPIHDDDLLAEILLRLPLPSSLPRASLVCTRWRRLVTDPYFLRRFRARNWRPLGFFLHGHGTEQGRENLSFAVISESEAPKLLSVRHEESGGGDGYDAWEFCGCRHGRALLLSRDRPHIWYGVRRVLVWNPVTGEHHFVDVPPHLSDPDQSRFHVQAALTCASGDDKGPFQVALAWADSGNAHACVYSSAAGEWGDVVVSAPLPSQSSPSVGYWNVLVGNSLYWMLFHRKVCVLEFDLGSQNLAMIEVPRDAYADHRGLYMSTLAKGGGLSLISMTADLRAQDARSDGVAGWMLGATIDLAQLLLLGPERGYGWYKPLLGIAGDDNMMFVPTCSGVFMVHLKSMQFEKIFETNPLSLSGTIHPYAHSYFP
ncbi:hypothetical protein U9M48_005398, partial [Paspalum notatum var. saurae]